MSSASNEASPHVEKKRIAIIGSGISGLAALYSLRETQHEVHLFEKDHRLGGHTNTLGWQCPKSDNIVEVDTGFIVINTATYPNLLNFLGDLDIKTVPTEMTFAVSRDQGEFEWSGDSPFCQKGSWRSLSHLRMLFDFVLFNTFATDILREPNCDENQITIGEYLDQHGYSKSFRDNYLLPMTACVWSTGPEKCALDFPAVTLIRFMMNHKLLNTFSKRPQWLTIPGGSKQYITQLMKDFPKDRIHRSSPVVSVTTTLDGSKTLVKVETEDGASQFYDNVIMACHGDQAYQLRKGNMSADEERILSKFETTPSTAYLHSDRNLLPVHNDAWSAWNYISSSSRKSSAHPFSQTVSLTYNMNILQHLDRKACGDVLVTLNPPNDAMPAAERTQAKIEYRHPLYNNAAVRAQSQLDSIQGKHGIYYAGAWTGYGFHEDGCTSGLLAAKSVGGSTPFEVIDLRVAKPIPDYTVSRHILRLFLHFLSFLGRLLLLFLGLAGVDPKLESQSTMQSVSNDKLDTVSHSKSESSSRSQSQSEASSLSHSEVSSQTTLENSDSYKK